MKKLIIVPAYNEEDNIKNTIQNLRLLHDYDFVIVNDCSLDCTLSITREQGANFLNLANNLGIGGAVQTGYIYAEEHGYDIAVQVDADGQHDLGYLDALIKPIEEGKANICIGSRFITKEGFQSTTIRRLGIGFLSNLIRLVTGHRILDVTSGFRAVDRNMILFYARNYPRDYPEPEAIVTAIKKGAKIIEVPVIMKKRQGGCSSIDLKKSIYYMIKVSLAVCLAKIVKQK